MMESQAVMIGCFAINHVCKCAVAPKVGFDKSKNGGGSNKKPNQLSGSIGTSTLMNSNNNGMANICHGCGMKVSKLHYFTTCPFRPQILSHPDWNDYASTKKPFNATVAFANLQKRTLADGKTKLTHLNPKSLSDGSSWVINDEKYRAFKSVLAKWQEAKKVRDTTKGIAPCILLDSSMNKKQYFSVCQVHVKCDDAYSLKVEDCLLDTGAEENFVDYVIVVLLKEHGSMIIEDKSMICTAFNHNESCQELTHSIKFDCTFVNKFNKTESIPITARIANNLRQSLIIGRRTIGKYNLLPKLTNLIDNPSIPVCMEPVCTKPVCTEPVCMQQVCTRQNCTERCHLCNLGNNKNKNDGVTLNGVSQLSRDDNPCYVNHDSSINTTVKTPSGNCLQSVQCMEALSSNPVHFSETNEITSKDCLLCTISERSSAVFGSAKDDDLLDEPDSSFFDDLLDHSERLVLYDNKQIITEGSENENSNSEKEIISLIEFVGTDAMIQRMKSMCSQYVDVFALEVKATPANVPPMEFTVDANKLKRARGKLTPRPQHPTKLDALKLMITELLRLGVIRVSHQDTASQVLLVAKKGTDKLRFCIDYRALNEASSMEGWPLPHIKTLIATLGAQHASMFGIMDLTSGYHQAPLAELVKSYTAFITAFGMFEWNRVPMGLKGAPSYFQRIMMVNVLGDLLHKTVEVYLDDMIIFGKTEEEFIVNMELLFQRLRKVNLTCNPKKCRFGLSEIEYVGHTLNKDGWTFSRSQIDRVLDWPMPENKGEMKQFLGLCNYFHTHVKDMSTLTNPLSDLVYSEDNVTYTKRQRATRIEWDEKSRLAFQDLKEAIDNLPLLHFIDVRAPIYLETDASDYGIGGVLYQIDNSDEKPVKIIEFFSKSLSGQLRNWSTPDKEAYAIYYAFVKYDYLLHNSKFILRTDHKNLTYINFEGSKKVLRWKMLLQQYDFQIEYIEGADNVMADPLSRLCQKNEIVTTSDSANIISSDVINGNESNTDRNAMILSTMVELESIFDLGNDLLVLEEEDISIPQDKYVQIESVHNAMVGHNGVNRTMLKLNRKGIRFPKMRMWVRQFIQMCPFCQKMEYKRLKANVVPFTLATYEAMLKLSMDSIGPLPEDSRGNKYILVIIDTFTRWTMCYPLQSLSATDCVRAIIQHIGIFGAPSEFVTDNGSQFNNSLIDEIVSMFRDKYKIAVKHSTALAYSHEEQGIVERANREVLEGMKAIVYAENSTYYWSDYIPFVQRILNTEVHSSTLWAPSQLVFGTAINLDRGILTPNIEMKEHNHKEYDEYAKRLINAQKHAIEAAKFVQIERDKRHIAKSMVSTTITTITEFNIGSYVLMEHVDTGMSKKPPNKLMTHLAGPYQVMSYKGPHYVIRHLNHNTVQTVHVSRLSVFIFDKSRIDPKQVTAKDNCEWFVERAVRHFYVDKNNIESQDRRYRKNSHLYFEIEWVGVAHTTIEPWHNLVANSRVHQYMRQNRLKSVIPRHYRLEQDEDV